jgi:hypothetical protein
MRTTLGLLACAAVLIGGCGGRPETGSTAASHDAPTRIVRSESAAASSASCSDLRG